MIRHVSGVRNMASLGSWVQLYADRHEVTDRRSFPGVGRCDSCGRVVVRGCGRWWEGRLWS